MHCEWLYPPDMYTMIDTWHMYAMIDTWLNTWLYCMLSILLFIYFMYFTSYLVYCYNSIVVLCTYCLCTCTFSHFTHSLGVFDSLDLHIQVYGCYIVLIKYLRRILRITRSQSSFCMFIISRYLFLRLFILIHFIILCIMDSTCNLLEHLNFYQIT